MAEKQNKNISSVNGISSSHMVGGWRVWDDILLRSTGFPAHLVTDMSWRDTPQLVTEYESQILKLQRLLAGQEKAKLKKWGDKIRQQLMQDSFNFLQMKQMPADVQQLLAPFASFMEIFQALFQERRGELIERMREQASRDYFLEAVTWQNLDAVKNSIEPFIGQSGKSYNSSTRRKAHLVMNYLQRFCLKNDTIGFFGPLNWAKIDAAKQKSKLAIGQGLIRERRQFFEYWSVFEFAQALIQDLAIRKFLKPRLNPMGRLDNGIFYGPYGKIVKLPPGWARLLAHCDGTRTADAIARREKDNFRNEEEIFSILEQMAGNGPVIWQFDVPVYLRSQEKLRDNFNEMPDGAARKICLAHLDRLEEQLNAIGAAAGDSARLQQELAMMNHVFSDITGKSATHGGGKLYAGRTLIYEDCTRDVDLTLGADFLKSSEHVLDLIMTSGRWFTWQIAQQLSEFFMAIFDELAEENATEVLPLDIFLTNFKNNRIIVEEIIKDVRAQLQEKWWEILACDDGGRAYFFSSADITDKVKKAFEAPMPGWVGAGYYSPDLMISASSLEELAQGNGKIIVGEFHMALNPFLAPSVNEFHPDADQIIQQIEQDLQIERILTVPEGHTIGHRTIQDRFPDNITHILINDTASILPPEKTVAISELQLVRQEGRLKIISRDGKHHFDLIGQADFLFKGFVAGNFNCLGHGEHMPRITIDNVVLAREEWRFTASMLSFSYITEKSHQFIKANSWRQAHELPHYIFLKTPVEGKPIFIDFHNPISVDSFCKYIRQTASKDKNLEIMISEMLPGPDDLWLKDKDGNGYASELRFVMRDPVAWNIDQGEDAAQMK